MRYFTSDTHFGHKNIIEYCVRPFANVEEMTQVMIDNWNEVVKPEDTIYHLGDFAFLKQDKMAEILGQLNGHKILIKGNHDKGKNVMVNVGFQEAYDHLKIDLNGESVWLCHYPYPFKEADPYHEDPNDPDAYAYEISYVGQPKDDGHTWLLHGHVHTAWRSKKRMINVGVDVWNFKPLSELEIVETISKIRNLS